MKTSSVEFISRSPNMKSEHRRFVLLRKIVETKEKRNRFEQTSRIGKYRNEILLKHNGTFRIFSSGLHGNTAADSVSEWPFCSQNQAVFARRRLIAETLEKNLEFARAGVTF
ncbi:hypothetical protein TNCV_182501 [Trichonephila clavipes]|nr:hypothetical protein TNCV_182501 [Trichonephila clavipes]